MTVSVPTTTGQYHHTLSRASSLRPPRVSSGSAASMSPMPSSVGRSGRSPNHTIEATVGTMTAMRSSTNVIPTPVRTSNK